MHKPESYNTSIFSLDYSPNRQVCFLRLKIHSDHFIFKEGQFVMFLYKDGEKVIKRSYSIATTHSEYLQNKTIGFIVKYVSEGFMSNYFFSKAKPGDEIEII
jgi:ferredoxin-NADP reductase